MKLEKLAALQLIALFFLASLFGLAIAKTFIGEKIKTSFGSEDPESITNTFGIMVYILVVTLIFFLIVVKIKIQWFAALMEAIAVFSAMLVFFSVFLPGTEIIFSVTIMLLRYLLKNSVLLKNFVAFTAVSVAGPLIGVSIGIIPIVLFLVFISLYDIHAVFFTKHMVKMAKSITKKNLAFTFTILSKKKSFELGTGDIVLPLAFASSILKFSPNPFLVVPIVLFASLFGLLLTLAIAETKKIPLPALPLQSALMLVSWITTTIVF